MVVEDLILKLLSEGVIYNYPAGSVSKINEVLNICHFEAVEWPDKSCILLKDASSITTPIFPWNEEKIDQTKEIFKKIIFKEQITDNFINELIETGWVEHNNGNYSLSKRALVQHTEFIMALNGRYKVCDVCKFLCDEIPIHDYCRKLLQSKKIKIE